MFPHIDRIPDSDLRAFEALQLAKVDDIRRREWKVRFRTDSPNLATLLKAYDDRADLRISFTDGEAVTVRVIGHSYGPHAGAGNTEFHFREVLPEDRPHS